MSSATKASVYAASLSTVDLDGQRNQWQCKHEHRTLQAAALCGQQEVRRRLPNTRDKAVRARYLVVHSTVLVKSVEDRTYWYDWAAVNNFPTR